MAPEDQEQRIEELFAKAKELRSEEQTAFLDETCRDHPPEVREVVEKLLAADRRNAAIHRPAEAPLQGRAVRLNCPHCHNPIELVVDRQDEVVCPSCGSTFHLDAGRTQTWNKDNLPALGKFALLAHLGFGAFGTVYKAFDTELKRTVALKIPRSGTLAGKDDEDRFFREARNAAQLRHAGIVPVFEVGRSEQFPFIVSELVEGITLADSLSGRRFGFRETAQLVRQLALALDYSHKQGVVHRDLKPSNIMLSVEDMPRIMDFGLAKRDAGEITMTMDGQVIGTPAYMSPEQASGKAHEVDGRSDVYSLGVILFELLTSELPFRGNPRMLLHQVLHNEPRAPRSLNDRVPRDLETICLKAMDKEPKRRYQTANELGDDLGRYLNGVPIHARPVGRVERAWRWCRRNPTVAVLSASTGALLVALTIGASMAALAWQQNRVAQLTETVRMVDKELQPAKSLVDSGWQQARQPELWRTTLEDATQKLKQAELVVATREATPELIDQVGAVRRELDKALQALQLAVEIDGCLAGILAGHQNYAEAAKSLPAIFNRAGIDVLGSDSDRIADWVKHHPVSDSLVVILAAWSFWETDSEITKRLGNILLKIDPSRIFAGMQWLIALRMKNTAQLERLAQSPDAMIMPPKALVLMGIALRWSGDSDAAVRMLRRWQALYPDEFWLNLQLGHELLGLKEPRPREAISYMLVAVALRKEYSRSHFGLASAYDAAGDHVEALDAYEKALDCGLKQADLESAKWLRAAIERWSNLARENKQAGRVQDAIKRWQALRDRVTVARLSPEEQKAWTEFWIDLDELLKRVQVKK